MIAVEDGTYVLEAGLRKEPVPVDEVAGVVRVDTKELVPALMGLAGPQHPEGPVRQAGQRAPDGDAANLAEHDLKVHGPPKHTWIGRIEMDYTCDREVRARDADPDRRRRTRDRTFPGTWS